MLQPSTTARLDLVYRLSQAFNSSLQLDQVLNSVLDEVIAIMQAERGFVMLVDEHDQLEFRVARGIDQQTIEHPDFQISRSLIEKVRRDGVPIITTDAQKDERFAQQHSIIALGLRSILCVPLRIKDRITGILYVDHRMISGVFTYDDRELLSSIAASAAIAIDNAQLFNDLKKSKFDLEVAYDTTLEGWAKALELRDQVTEGHTRRVTEITCALARNMSLPESDIIHIRRGALLHDIGKMGIPDNILLKPGSLTPEEYAIMKKHTVFAYEMLYPIEFLRPALDIPLCHHERWDGSGYPRGLKGIQIPLFARLFSVVDVWDALTSNRPYRIGWSEEKTHSYLQRQSGKQFDPFVVQIFIQMLRNSMYQKDSLA
jgi:putative nucleotidyltransferase with HDIG domain